MEINENYNVDVRKEGNEISNLLKRIQDYRKNGNTIENNTVVNVLSPDRNVKKIDSENGPAITEDLNAVGALKTDEYDERILLSNELIITIETSETSYRPIIPKAILKTLNKYIRYEVDFVQTPGEFVVYKGNETHEIGDRSIVYGDVATSEESDENRKFFHIIHPIEHYYKEYDKGSNFTFTIEKVEEEYKNGKFFHTYYIVTNTIKKVIPGFSKSCEILGREILDYFKKSIET